MIQINVLNHLVLPLLVIAIVGLTSNVVMTQINSAEIEDIEKEIDKRWHLLLPTVERLARLESKLELCIQQSTEE